MNEFEINLIKSKYKVGKRITAAEAINDYTKVSKEMVAEKAHTNSLNKIYKLNKGNNKQLVELLNFIFDKTPKTKKFLYTLIIKGIFKKAYMEKDLNTAMPITVISSEDAKDKNITENSKLLYLSTKVIFMLAGNVLDVLYEDDKMKSNYYLVGLPESIKKTNKIDEMVIQFYLYIALFNFDQSVEKIKVTMEHLQSLLKQYMETSKEFKEFIVTRENKVQNKVNALNRYIESANKQCNNIAVIKNSISSSDKLHPKLRLVKDYATIAYTVKL